MDNVRVLVLRAAGVNCDEETAFAFELAGAQAQRVHINRLIENPAMLDDFAIMVFPGGFSYGDDVAAGKILANQVVHHLVEPIRRFIESGRLALGICNGFQVLLKAGFLPGWDGAVGSKSFADLPVSITDNDRPQYECRWVYLEPASDRCVFLTPGQRLCVPMAHGEGKIVTRDAAVLSRLQNENYIAFRYVDADGQPGPFPINPNGAVDSIAGLTDSTGRILGLMPHPERHIHRTQHPHWTRLGEREPDGLTIFRNAVNYAKSHL